MLPYVAIRPEPTYQQLVGVLHHPGIRCNTTFDDALDMPVTYAYIFALTYACKLNKRTYSRSKCTACHRRKRLRQPPYIAYVALVTSV